MILWINPHIFVFFPPKKCTLGLWRCIVHVVGYSFRDLGLSVELGLEQSQEEGREKSKTLAIAHQVNANPGAGGTLRAGDAAAGLRGGGWVSAVAGDEGAGPWGQRARVVVTGGGPTASGSTHGSAARPRAGACARRLPPPGARCCTGRCWGKFLAPRNCLSLAWADVREFWGSVLGRHPGAGAAPASVI